MSEVNAPPMYLKGAVEPESGIGSTPGFVAALKVLDPLYVGAPAGNHRWTLVNVPGPSILYPCYGPNYAFTPWATTAAGVAPPNITSFLPTLIYTWKQPQQDSVAPFITPTWQHSVNGGICFLDRAGDWYVGLDATVPLTVVIIPVFNAEQANRFLRGLRPNTRHMFRMDAAASGTGTGAAGLILGWDIRRRGYWIVNNAGATFQVKFGDSGTGPFVPLAAGTPNNILRVGPDEAPMAPVFGEMAAGGAVANGLTIITDLL